MGEKSWFRFSRTFLLIVGSILSLLIIAYCWGLQIVMSWKLRREVNRIPILAMVPQSLPSVSPNLSPGVMLSDAGFSFEVPWDDLDAQRTKYIGLIAVYAFRSGRVVSFYPPSPTGEDLMSAVEKNFGGKPALALFGPEATKSNYAFHKTILDLTPARMSPWMNQREAIRTSMLLTIKAISSVGGQTGLFKADTNEWRGFQFDDPTKQPKTVTLELYDSQDRHVEIIFMTKKESGADITQPDINRVLRTLKPADQLSSSQSIALHDLRKAN